MISTSGIHSAQPVFQSAKPAQKPVEKPGSDVFSGVRAQPRFAGELEENPGIFKTLNTLRSHLTKPGNVEYLKGYAFKYGPDAAVPALFSIPVVGWAAGLLLLPFTGWTNKKGDTLINKALAQDANKNNPFSHLIHMSKTWSGDLKDWDKLKKESGKDVVETLKDHYDNFVDKLLPDKHDEKIRNTIRIGKKGKNSQIYKLFEDLVNTKLRLNKSFFRHFAAPFNLIHKGLSKVKFFPRALSRVFLLPKFVLFGLFFAARKMR